VEIARLRQPIGKQDQYAAAYGGMNLIRFHSDESVDVEPIRLSSEAEEEFSQRLLMFYLGQERQATDILEQQARNMADHAKFARVREMVRLAEQFRAALAHGQFALCGELMNEGWRLKRELAGGITNELVDDVYERAMAAGASGGKVLGAGGGGFLLLYCEPHRRDRLRAALSDLREMPFRFSPEGSRVIYADNGVPVMETA
jgi:D-glycero-alpha-D-manno-heptose-7-phosphate kinase